MQRRSIVVCLIICAVVVVSAVASSVPLSVSSLLPSPCQHTPSCAVVASLSRDEWSTSTYRARVRRELERTGFHREVLTHFTLESLPNVSSILLVERISRNAYPQLTTNVVTAETIDVERSAKTANDTTTLFVITPTAAAAANILSVSFALHLRYQPPNVGADLIRAAVLSAVPVSAFIGRTIDGARTEWAPMNMSADDAAALSADVPVARSDLLVAVDALTAVVIALGTVVVVSVAMRIPAAT